MYVQYKFRKDEGLKYLPTATRIVLYLYIYMITHMLEVSITYQPTLEELQGQGQGSEEK